MDIMMNKYVIFFKENSSRIIKKDLVDHDFVKKMKSQGYRKHHVEIEAENEKEAKNKFIEFNSGYLDSLKDISGSAVICAISVIVIAVIFIIRTW